MVRVPVGVSVPRPSFILPPKEWAVVGAGVFAGTTIDPSALVQRLDLDARSVASIRRGAEAKAVLPKKEKLKLRRERWLQRLQCRTMRKSDPTDPGSFPTAGSTPKP